jgi:hypothetical protein
MTFGDMIQKAVTTDDAALAGKIVDRARSMGATYDNIFAAAHRVTGIDQATWDALLERADELDADVRV